MAVTQIAPVRKRVLDGIEKESKTNFTENFLKVIQLRTNLIHAFQTNPLNSNLKTPLN